MTVPLDASTPDRSDRRADLVVAAATVLLGIALAASASHASIWYDELASLRFAHLPLDEWVRVLYRGEANGVLHHTVLRVLVPITGDSLLAIRAPAVLAWVAGIPVLYALGKRVAPPPAAAAAAIVYGLVPLGVDHAMEARMYSFAATVALVTTLLLARYVEAPTVRRGAVYGIAAALGLACHFMVVPVVAAQGLALLLHPERRALLRNAWAGALLVGLAAVPLLVVVERNRTRQISWIPSSSAEETREVLAQVLGIRWDGGWPVEPMLILPALALIGLGVWAAVQRTAVGSDALPAAWVARATALWLFVPVGTVLVVSWLVTPMLIERYLIVAVPAAVLLCLVGARTLARSLPSGGTAVSLVVVGLAILAMVPRGSDPWTDDHYGEDWRGTAAFVARQLQPGDVVLVSDSSGGDLGADGLRYQRDDDLADIVLSFDDVEDGADVGRPTRVWVVSRQEADTSAHEQAASTLDVLGFGGTPVEQWDVSAFRVALYEPEP